MSLSSEPKLPRSKFSNPWILGLLVVATTLTGATAIYGISRFGQPQATAQAPAPAVTKVTALGRLEPEAEVINLSAPLALDGDRILELRVKQGDRVKAGQIVAVLDSRDRLESAVREAQERVRIAQARLAQVRAGAKTGEVQAQQATITRLQAELAGEVATQNATIARWESEARTAQADYERFRQLYQQGAIAASSLDSRRLAAETAMAQLQEARARQSRTSETLKAQLREAGATLNRIAEVRPVDVQAAQAEVDAALAALQRADTEREQALIRAPIAGQILKIHTRAGEKIGDTGVVDLGQTAEMVAVAEVYQTDIGKIRLGQPATITGQAFAGELAGSVSEIGLQIRRQNTFSNTPGENLDRRVVEVKIRLTPEASKQVAGLTNLQVQAAIQL